MTIDRITVWWFVSLVAAIILHEVSHGVAALSFGDDTARRAGRITLNPLPHIDPFGSLILPAMAVLGGFPAIGWAKPVPVNPARLRNPRRDMVWVSLAGPGANFALMTVAAIAARLVLHAGGFVLAPGPVYLDDLPTLVTVLYLFALVNLFLGLFNLLPIPPLDGSALLARALPARHQATFHRLAPYGFLIIFALVFWTGFVGSFLEPFQRRLGEFVLT